MNRLESTMIEIKKLKEVAEMNPGTDAQKRKFNLGRIRQAKEKLELKYIEYRQQIVSNSLFMIVVGDMAKDFADMSREKYDCFAYSSDEFYKKILDQVPSKLYIDKPASRNMFEHIAARFEDRAREIDIIGYQPLVFEAKYKKVLKSEEEALDLVKRAINEKIGSEVSALDAIEKTSQEAVDKEFAGKVIPIVLYTSDEVLAKELLEGVPRVTKKVFMVNVGKKLQNGLQNKTIAAITEVSEENVEKVLLKIKEKV